MDNPLITKLAYSLMRDLALQIGPDKHAEQAGRNGACDAGYGALVGGAARAR